MTEMWINMGPQHPMTHGLWNLRVLVDGETIADAKPEIGYLHRGIEKISEHRTYDQIIPLCDRLGYASAMTWSHCYCLTVEDLLGIEVPPRAEYIRVVVLELQRIASHLMWLAAYTPDLGLLAVFLYALRERELFLDLLQSVSGNRMEYNYPRIGGVRNDLPYGFEHQTLKVLDHFEKKLKEYEEMMDDSSIWLIRNQDVGILKKSDAIDLGVSGPTLRGSNCKHDTRVHTPYSVYHELDWEPQVEKDCDCYARYVVRMKEMYESCHIVRQALKKMPKGEVRIKAPRHVPAGATFRRTEDSRGEAMMYLVSDGSDRPYRWKIRSPVFVNVLASPKFLIGYKVADVPAIMGSVDLVVGEMDR
ncbi:MAG: NADH-quinone oxidoreductase subunit D [Thermoplasmata archaeon]|nr:MAG: NADH-quinone oxidoreductase subunit D [Thermoplasmata archaeon]